MTTFTRVYLKAGREKSVRNKHPWIFSGAIYSVIESSAATRIDHSSQTHTEAELSSGASVAPGCPVEIYSRGGDFLALGYYNKNSQIACRVLTRERRNLDASFFESRIHGAWRLRQRVVDFSATDSFRLINSEGDSLPGLVVDKYANVLVTQFNTAGMAWWRPVIIRALVAMFNPTAVAERSDSPMRAEEGIAPFSGVHYGELSGPVIGAISGLKLSVSIQHGHKTGFYLDQAANLSHFAKALELEPPMAGKTLLNCFSYSGAFSVVGAKHGLHTVSIDTSAPALSLARENFQLNQLDASAHEFVEADCFEYLRDCDSAPSVIVLDPPPFARRRSQVDSASRGYKDLHLHSFKKIAPGGLIFTYSCSQHVSRDLFQKIIFGAAVDANREVRILSHLTASPDHPVSVFHPEGEYLKGFLLYVD